MNAIEIKHLTKNYSSFQLEDIDFVLPSGCIMGLVGENGAGKSTTIGLIMDSIKRDAGEIFVLGKDNAAKEFRQVKEDIGGSFCSAKKKTAYWKLMESSM